jgi:hypothetical protein
MKACIEKHNYQNIMGNRITDKRNKGDCYGCGNCGETTG